MMSESGDPFYAPDGVKCEKCITTSFTIIDKQQEVFQMDEDYTRLSNPKFVKFKDGHKERYNPSKHIGGSGKSSDKMKVNNSPKPAFKGRPKQKVYKGDTWWAWDSEDNEWKEEQ